MLTGIEPGTDAPDDAEALAVARPPSPSVGPNVDDEAARRTRATLHSSISTATPTGAVPTAPHHRDDLNRHSNPATTPTLAIASEGRFELART
ncbi:hypothetical protein AB0C84_41600 [Actinomadura sp. NPDC048955]|uniref:hypothetical protein n=1 Tax=Actinomadura sp. NPDC048955 TaxID=3158228 RepID=UPI0033CADEF5